MKSKKTVKVTTMVLMLILVTMLTLSGCGGSETVENNGVENESVESNVENEVSESSENIPEWKEFLAEYEAWVDEYIALMKKYKANPTDLTILADYTKMVEELADWQADADEMEAELENASAAELAEYTKELARIVSKLSQITEQLK